MLCPCGLGEAQRRCLVRLLAALDDLIDALPGEAGYARDHRHRRTFRVRVDDRLVELGPRLG